MLPMMQFGMRREFLAAYAILRGRWEPLVGQYKCRSTLGPIVAGEGVHLAMTRLPMLMKQTAKGSTVVTLEIFATFRAPIGECVMKTLGCVSVIPAMREKLAARYSEPIVSALRW